VIDALNNLGKKIMYINKEDEGRVNWSLWKWSHDCKCSPRELW
jgi:hypothetical protein